MSRPATTTAGTSATDNTASSGSSNAELLERIKLLEETVIAQRNIIDETVSMQKAARKGQELADLSINVPADLKTKIIEGKCVDLSLLLAKSLLEKEEDDLLGVNDEGRVVKKKERKPKSDLTIDQWTTAFMVYMSVYLQHHDNELQPMLAYQEMVRGLAREHRGDAWARYDLEFRSRKEADPTRSWRTIDNQLWLQLFTQSPKEHITELKAKVSGNSQKSPHTYPAICHYFNKAQGCRRQNCEYSHRCSVCKSRNHPATLCTAKKDRESTQSSSITTDQQHKAPFRIGGHKQ